MFGIVNFDEVIAITVNKCKNYSPDRERRMVGLLFLKPTSKLVAAEILASGEYFHARTGKEIDFFLPGYGPRDWESDDKVFDINIGETGFVLRMADFVSCIKSLQQDSTWKYSGETDLLLLDVIVKNGALPPAFDTENVICCNLDSLIENGAITSIHGFLEIIIQYIESGKHDAPTRTFSDLMGLKRGRDGFINYLSKSLPGDVGQEIQNTVSFRTRSIQANA